jgi:CheY-like chemotaxis protein
MASNLILITDDVRLLNKAERLSKDYSVPITLCSRAEETSIDALQKLHLSESAMYCFLDLDVKVFDGYALASEIRSSLPHAQLIAFTLGIDPHVIQKTKLVGIESVLQRFKFEELLKKVCENSATQ